MQVMCPHNERSLLWQGIEKLEKLQIMEAYLNTVLFGSNIYGIKMAARYYFNKSPKEITTNEAAILAGMIQLQIGRAHV